MRKVTVKLLSLPPPPNMFAYENQPLPETNKPENKPKNKQT